MKKLSTIFIILFAFLFFNSCTEQKAEQQNATPKIKVKVAKITKGHLPDYIEFSGKTVYLNKSNLIAPISGYVTSVNAEQGDVVTKGKLLFEMQTSEAFVMQQNDSTKNNYGKIKVFAPASGRIVNLNIVDKGVFSDKGAVMCNILASNDLKVQVNVPFEYKAFSKIGNKCKIILPDNTEIQGVFSMILPQVDEVSQTIKMMANIRSQNFLPENMILKVLVDKSQVHQVQILPKKCLQTDALMTRFWVMKLINDSIAAQTFVTIGNQNHDKVEILSPVLNADDLFVSEGAYGLSDTALVEIIH